MAIYKVSRPSDCGTYFQPYLQSVTIVADSRAEAEATLEQWFKKENESFVKSKYPPQWEVLVDNVTSPNPCIIDYVIDSDY